MTKVEIKTLREITKNEELDPTMISGGLSPKMVVNTQHL